MHLAALLIAVAAAAGQQSRPAQDPKPTPPPAAQSQSLKRLSIEELSRIAVVSASRRSEPLTEAASAVSVITSDTIRRAGITTVKSPADMGATVARVAGKKG